MIIKRKQKEYSSKTLKLVRATKQLGNRISTGMNNFGLQIGNAITPASKLGGPKVKFKPKSSYQLNRETIALRDKAREVKHAVANPVQTAAPTIVKAKEALTRVAANPGAAVDKGVEMSLRNPVAVSGNVGGKVLMVTNPGTATIPFGPISIGAETALKKNVPQYAKITERAATGYKRSRLSDLVRGGTNAIYTQFGGIVV